MTKKKGFLGRLRSESITLSPAFPFVSVTYRTEKKKVQRKRARKSRGPTELNPIQQVTVPQLSRAKELAVQRGEVGGATIFAAMEFALETRRDLTNS